MNILLILLLVISSVNLNAKELSSDSFVYYVDIRNKNEIVFNEMILGRVGDDGSGLIYDRLLSKIKRLNEIDGEQDRLTIVSLSCGPYVKFETIHRIMDLCAKLNMSFRLTVNDEFNIMDSDLIEGGEMIGLSDFNGMFKMKNNGRYYLGGKEISVSDFYISLKSFHAKGIVPNLLYLHCEESVLAKDIKPIIDVVHSIDDGLEVSFQKVVGINLIN